MKSDPREAKGEHGLTVVSEAGCASYNPPREYGANLKVLEHAGPQSSEGLLAVPAILVNQSRRRAALGVGMVGPRERSD